MTRLAITALVLLGLIGCPTKKEDTTPDGTGSGSGPAQLAKKVSISWGIQQAGEMADLYLALTDETGRVASHQLGRYKGSCSVTSPSPGMNALTAVTCRTGGTGTELHVVTQGGDTIIVLQMGVDEGVAPDPMSRQEVKRIRVPLGAAIEVEPMVSTTGAPGAR
jgi:hypothetical protein